MDVIIAANFNRLLASVQAARYSEADDAWLIEGSEVSHTLKCFAAYRGDNDEDDEGQDEA